MARKKPFLLTLVNPNKKSVYDNWLIIRSDDAFEFCGVHGAKSDTPDHIEVIHSNESLPELIRVVSNLIPKYTKELYQALTDFGEKKQ